MDCGFGFSDKESARDGSNVGLGLKMQSTESESYPFKKKKMNMMMMVTPQPQQHNAHHNHHRPFSSSCERGCVGNGEARRTLLQSFDISDTAFKSPGAGEMAGSRLGEFPFTRAQWKELERQAMIYKYIIASVPVPPDLLLPVSTTNLSDPSASSISTLVRFSNNKDPEPWRCKRTDGKKWRCSRNVAQNQKYCERHMHRGRPRSRKPVELHSDFNNNKNNNSRKTSLHHNVIPSSALVFDHTISDNNGGSSVQCVGSGYAQPYSVNPLFLAKSDSKADLESVVSISSYKEPGTMDWMMKGEVPMASTTTSDQQWQHLLQTKTGLMTTDQSSFCNQNYEFEPLNLNSYTNISGNKDPQNNPCSYSNFIDAWSNTPTEDNIISNKDSVSSNGKLSPSSLNLTMASNNSINDEMSNVQMSWLTTLGGPLAEVLRPGPGSGFVGNVMAESASNLKSFMAGTGNGDSASGSPRAHAVSSPSGVLQKTLASLSDSSCSSKSTDQRQLLWP